MTLDVSAQQEQAEQPEDGRTARGRRTREGVVEALLALQEEGALAPTAQQVAVRAGVALRTVFGHFSDMETLWAEAGQREMAKLSSLAQPVDPGLPLAQRIGLFCSSRARVLEALLPVMRAARLREPTSPQLQRNRRLFVAAGDAEVQAAFAAELDRLAPEQRARCLDALYLAAGGPAWESLRHDRDLSAESAEAVMRAVVSGLLAG